MIFNENKLILSLNNFLSKAFYIGVIIKFVTLYDRVRAQYQQEKFNLKQYDSYKQFAMNFNYRNYVTRYNYQPYCWPPDLSLAELHARCSQPGPINQNGVQCPCCQMWSKRKVHKWWKHNIDQDLKHGGTAIPGYFQLIKYYSCFAILVLLINSLYPIYATFYACQNLDTKHDVCLQVGALYYLQFNNLIHLLTQYGRQDMVDILLILQTAVFYILLAANYFSIIFITFLNDAAKRQFESLKSSQASRCLVFYNIDKSAAQNIQTLLKDQQGGLNTNIIRSLELYQVKKYYEYFIKRNKIYYHLLSLYVVAENPLKIRNLNQQLKNYHQIVLQQKQKFNCFNNKILVMFENVETCRNVNKIYRVQFLQKWWYGVRSLLDQFKIKKFQDKTIKLSTYTIGIGSDVLWQNLGQQLGIKMAIRIKTFFVAAVFIIVCYVVLYYPMMFSLKAHIKQQTKKYVHLNTFEKILPNLTAFALVGLSIYFRVYMDRLSQQRNPKDQLERAKFVLISCLTFHLLFYVLIPTFFFVLPGDISQTVKLFVISEQARTFIVIQVIIVIVDLPFTLWKKKKVKALSDQRVAFKNNQWMLNKIVECRDYPLQIRLQVLFRIWSLVLFYAFFIPYMTFYIIIAFFIIFWIEKRNLYKHYAIKRKVSIKLQSQTLIYYVNFFCVYLCFIYCYTVRGNTTKIIVAVVLTAVGLITNIMYWIILNKGQAKASQILLSNSQNLSKQQSLLKRQKLQQIAQKFSNSYKHFLQSIQNDKLDEQITLYLNSFRDFQQEKIKRRQTQQIELPEIHINEKNLLSQSQNQQQQQQAQQNMNSDQDYHA